MGETISQRLVDAVPFLDRIAEAVQPKVREAVDEGGTTVRNALDGKWLEVPLHPALTDVPLGSGLRPSSSTGSTPRPIPGP